MIGRCVPVILYVAAMIWVMTPPDETKQSRIYWIAQRIKFHRRLAEHHGRRVIALESTYAKACES